MQAVAVDVTAGSGRGVQAGIWEGLGRQVRVTAHFLPPPPIDECERTLGLLRRSRRPAPSSCPSPVCDGRTSTPTHAVAQHAYCWRPAFGPAASFQQSALALGQVPKIPRWATSQAAVKSLRRE
eukprot:365028-Chlamydomonas_euryale.AAC.44